MAYGPGSNGRNGRANGASRRAALEGSRADAWRDELKALQHRARTRGKRQRQKPRAGMRAMMLSLIVVGLGLMGLALMAFIGTIHVAASAYATINRDLPSINQIAGRETFKTAQLYDRKGRLLW